MKDPAVEAAALVFEARLIVEAVAFGLSRVIPQESSPEMAAALTKLQSMSKQAGDALDALQRTIVCAPPQGSA